jgi:hypothetical protein
VPWIAELQAMQAKNMLLELASTQLVEANAEIKRVKATFSWWITKPIRLLANLPRFMSRLLLRIKDASRHVD